MDNYRYIHEKLRDFIRKFYVNEIIRGGIFFLTLGLIYFLITLTIEHTLWLGVVGRTILFWLFILTEFVLLARFVLLPLLRLTGLKKGIGQAEASIIIGKHFKEVDDKLLNIIQLGENDVRTDLLVASIEQKASKLKPVPFKRAIEIKGNLKYLKYILIPVVIGGSIWLTGNKSFFTQSLNRVVHHNTVFLPPAPFQFKILNEFLTAIEDKSGA